MDYLTGVKGVLFDVDGTLVDSNDDHAQSWLDVFRGHGFEKVGFDEIRECIGMGGDKLLPTLTGVDSDSAKGKKMSEDRSELFLKEYAPSVRAFPGNRELFIELKKRGLSIAIATSASKQESSILLKTAGVDGLIDDKASADVDDNSKPDPDILLNALKKIGLSPNEAIMIGDTPYDLEAARRIGMPCVIFRCGGFWRDEDFHGAAAIFDGPAQFLLFLRSKEETRDEKESHKRNSPSQERQI